MDSVLIRQTGSIGWLALNRPKQLNALSLDMIRALRCQLDRWADDDEIQLVVLCGEGDRAFCAGGDIRALYDAKDEPRLETATAFFSEEYALDDRVAAYPKPVLALWDGIVMGGGVGLTYGARWKVVTERTRFAMPETGIGFFPDVGMCYHLSRLEGGLGAYLALTGETVSADVLLASGMANGHLSSGAWPKVRAQLEQLGAAGAPADEIGACLASEAAPDEERAIAAAGAFLANVRRFFDAGDLGEIFARLQSAASGDAFAAETLPLLRGRSPLSLAVTWEVLTRARRASYREVLRTDLALALAFIRRGDFIEGVRAQLVDKDRQPRWRHAAVEDVTPDEIARFFEPAEASIPFAQ